MNTTANTPTYTNAGERKWLCLAVLCAAASAAFLFSQTPRPSDDAYITFRHVRNLAESGVPAWNTEGPRVLGSTTPAFLFALALATKLTGLHDIPLLALAFNSACLFAIGLLAFLLARSILDDARVALMAECLVSTNALLVYIGSQGFESLFFAAAVLAIFLCLVHARDKTAIALVSLAPLIRPEGILLSVIAWPYLAAKRRARLRLLVLYLLIPAAWYLFATAYYGSCLPHSIEAKRHGAVLFWPYTQHAYNPLDNLRHFAPRFLAALRGYATKVLFSGAVLEPWHSAPRQLFCYFQAALLPLMIVLFVRKKSPALFCFVFSALFIALYTIISQPSAWYLPSHAVCMVLTLFTGSCLLVGTALDALAWRKRSGFYLAVCALIFATFFSLNRYTYHRGVLPESRPWVYARDPNKGDWSEMELTRYHAYREAAEFLNAAATQNPGNAMISEVGVFGYFFRGNVIDTGALCSPEVLPFYPPQPSDLADPQGQPYSTANHIVPAALVEALGPAYIVDSRIYIRNLERPGGILERNYQQIATLSPAWNAPVVVYRRKPAQSEKPL